MHMHSHCSIIAVIVADLTQTVAAPAAYAELLITDELCNLAQ
jgi:hypothetical protein